MSTFDKKAFQDQYLNHLQRDILMYQRPFPTIEEEFQKIAKKYDKNPSKKHFPGSLDLGPGDNVEFVEKFHSIINASSSKEFKDLKVLNKLAEYDQKANKHLKNLKEGTFVASPISQQIDRCVPDTNLDKLDTYQKVQRIVDKTIFNTVQELENDLTLLSARQKQNKVIDRLSNVQLPVGSPSATVRLPKLKEKSMRMTNKNRSFGGENVPETESKSPTQVPSLMMKDEIKPKALAGFYVKERKQKQSPERNKDVTRKNNIESFFKTDKRVKNLSKQYLFNLTQYNSPMHDTSSSRVYFETDVSGLQNGQKSFPNIAPPGYYPVEANEMLSSRTYGSYLAGNGSYLNNLSSEQTTQIRRTDVSMQDKKSFASPLGEKNNNKLKKNISSTSKPGHKSTKSMSHWLEKEKQLERSSEFIYEGMGLLTLHNGKKLPVQNPSAFTVNYFNLNIDKLEDRDRDYITAKTGVNIKHPLYDGLINEHDFLRFERKDLKLL